MGWLGQEQGWERAVSGAGGEVLGMAASSWDVMVADGDRLWVGSLQSQLGEDI